MRILAFAISSAASLALAACSSSVVPIANPLAQAQMSASEQHPMLAQIISSPTPQFLIAQTSLTSTTDLLEYTLPITSSDQSPTAIVSITAPENGQEYLPQTISGRRVYLSNLSGLSQFLELPVPTVAGTTPTVTPFGEANAIALNSEYVYTGGSYSEPQGISVQSHAGAPITELTLPQSTNIERFALNKTTLFVLESGSVAAYELPITSGESPQYVLYPPDDEDFNSIAVSNTDLYLGYVYLGEILDYSLPASGAPGPPLAIKDNYKDGVGPGALAISQNELFAGPENGKIRIYSLPLKSGESFRALNFPTSLTQLGYPGFSTFAAGP